MNSLLKKDIPFHWNAAQAKSFSDLKVDLTHAPVLAFPDYKAPFYFIHGCFCLGTSAVLMQTDIRKWEKTRYCISKANPVQSNYSAAHQEMLAIILALKQFKDIIFWIPNNRAYGLLRSCRALEREKTWW